MPDSYFYANLLDQLPEVPDDTIVSRTLVNNPRMRTILFGFAPGQELTEHTSSMAAILQFLQGEARLTLGSDSQEVKAGAWAHMQPNLPHSILARTPVVMLLILLKENS
jgi:quercetin dioxygenase-like cupin family protein